MNEEKNQKQPSSLPEETIPSTTGWKKFLKKRWFFPAMYLTAAAIILAFVMWLQNPDDFAGDPSEFGLDSVDMESALDNWPDSLSYEGEDALPVTTTVETMMWPYATDEQVQVVLGFFDDQATEEEQLEALVEFNKTFHPSQGISFSRMDGESFDVLASLSGTIIEVDKDPLVGNYVEIEHDQGLVTVYQSLDDIQVEVGDVVKQGDILGRAGRNVFHKDLDVHVHFEVREDGKAVNPDVFVSQGNSEIES